MPPGGRELTTRTSRKSPVGNRLSAGLLFITGTLLLFGAGCSGPAEPSGSAALQPVDASDGKVGSRPARDRRATSDTPAEESTGSGGEEATGTSTNGQHDTSSEWPWGSHGSAHGSTHPNDAADLAVVRALLARYDDLVTQLAVQPSTSLDPGAPIRLEWSELVPAESALSNSVLDQLVRGPVLAGTRLLPGPDGVSFRHHVDRTSRRDDASIEFSWCGYSPGIRIETATGKVIDDQVAHIRGIGRADRSQFNSELWVLDAFDQLDLKVLPPESGDPCPEHDWAKAGR